MGGAPYKSENKWLGGLLSVSTFNHKRALQQLDALEARIGQTITEPPGALESSANGTQNFEQHHEHCVAHSGHSIGCYICPHKVTL